ncbi:MAG: hypothetical protein JWO48_3560 [Bryobacterales bacterium]|nr:hypothetical protein [Bryobacterales bacterium]
MTGWGWPALFALGAFHGINPGMGWLFAVALGMQEKSVRAVIKSLFPITLGHAAAIAIVLLLAGFIQVVLPLNYVKISVAGALVALGLYRIVRSRHFQWGGMQVGFADLTFWSFLMASAHGAGLMVLPVVMKMPPMGAVAGHHMHAFQDPLTSVMATLVHTAGYLTVTAATAVLVYEKFGLALLRTAWVNLDVVWAFALMATGCLALIV